MSSFFDELKRRKVFRVAVAYAIVAWILVEVAATILPIFEAPDWTVQVFTVFIMLGFPIALILSWAYDLTPHGVERTKALPSVEGATQGTAHKLEFAIIGALVVGLGYVVLDAYVLTGESDQGPELVTNNVDLPAAAAVPADSTPTGAREAPERALLPNSVAVLPFENLSPDPDNAFFAAGIHEEVLNQLAKVSALNVIARTTMLQYADGEKSIRQIADELNVETVMEGSVRYADDRVLVTAQLIDPMTNVHLWSESYNREYADIFAIQADIAMNIAYALEAEFSVEEQEQIEKLPTDSPQAYALYLEAMQGGMGRISRTHLNEAIEIDPNFALAYGARAMMTSQLFRAVASGETASDAERSAREDARRALALDPTLSIAHVALAQLDEGVWRADDARAGYRRALRLKGADPEILTSYAALRANLGEFEPAILMAQHAVELDPSNYRFHQSLGQILYNSKSYEAALDAFQAASRLAPTQPGPLLMTAFVETRRGNDAEAVSHLRRLEGLSVRLNQFQLPRIALAYAQAGQPEDARRIVALLGQRDAAVSEDRASSAAAWTVAYIAVGDYEEALATLIEAIDNSEPGDFALLNDIRTNNFGDPVLDSDPRFVTARGRLQFTG